MQLSLLLEQESGQWIVARGEPVAANKPPQLTGAAMSAGEVHE